MVDPTSTAPSPAKSEGGGWEAPARTQLRSLPWLNRLFNDLPRFLAQTSAPSQSTLWRLPTSIIGGLSPADAASVSSLIFEQGQRARPEQSLVEKVQQERMKQESAAALSQSQQLAAGHSTLLTNSQRQEQSKRGQDLAAEPPPLSIQQAALASAIHHYRYGARAIGKGAKVTFQALKDRMPKRARTVFLRHLRRRPKAPSPASPSVPSGSAETKRAAAHDREAFRALRRTPKSIVHAAWRLLTECFRQGIFCLHLALLLIAQMGLFGRWVWMTIRLMIFALFLVQAWLKIGLTVLLCHRIERSVQYGPFNRNFLDIYLPTNIRGSILRPIQNNQYQPDYTQADAPAGGAVRTKHPVFVYVTGGAWVIGYKGWGALLGLVLRAQGCLVVSVDYRNFPQGSIEDMVVDVEQALRWIYGHIEDFGGDREQIFLSGQSAGGQITSLLLLRNAKREAQGAFDEELREEREGGVDDEAKLAHTQAAIAEAATIAEHAAQQSDAAGDREPSQLHHEEAKDGAASDDDVDLPPPATDEAERHPNAETGPPQLQLGVSSSSLLAVSTALRTGFPVSRIKGYIGISGVYSMNDRMLNHLHASGLPGGVVLAIMGGQQHLDAVNPTRMIQQAEFSEPAVVSKFPPTLIIAGTADRSVPLIVPRSYATALADAGVPVSFRSYINGTHTSPIIESPLRGCHHLTHDVIQFFQQCQSGEAELGRDRQHTNAAASGGQDGASGVRRSAGIPIRHLPALPFVVNGEVMVNALSVRCAAFFNPF